MRVDDGNSQAEIAMAAPPRRPAARCSSLLIVNLSGPCWAVENRMKKAIIGLCLAALLCLCALVGSGWRLLQVQWVHAGYPGGVSFIGMRRSEKAPTTFFSVRVKGADRQPIPAGGFLTLHWRDKSFLVSEISTSTLGAAGIQSEPYDYRGPEAEYAFIGGATEQNQDYGIEFHFVSGRLVEFYARHNDRDGVSCPFELSGSNGDRIRFPFGEPELRECFGAPESIIGVWRH